jgi:tetratricopeptide (TPR) repeat protein
MKIGKDDIFTAPVIEGAVPPTELQLLQFLAADGRRIELLFSLGNVYLREGRVAEAEHLYREALKSQEPGSEQYRLALNTNLGVACAADGKLEEALSFFRQAILVDTQHPLPHLHSARVQIALKQSSAAAQSLEKVLKIDPHSSEALLLSAQLREEAGNLSEALELYRRAYERDPRHETIKIRLARASFEQGREIFESGRTMEAFALWAEGFSRYQPAYSVDQQILNQTAELLKREAEKGGLKTELEQHRQKLLSNPDDGSQLFVLLSYFLFSVGLIAECYEAPEDLTRREEYWRRNLEEKGEHPYPHFRLGLLAAMSGRLEQAESELRHCQDKLLPKKQATLKLKQLLRFIGELREMQRLAREGIVSSSPDWEWEAAGFANPFELKSWKNSGIRPTQAKLWRDAGLSAAQAREWSKQKVPAEEAHKWFEAGFREGKAVRKFMRAGMGPNEAKAWSEHFGPDVEQAIQCRSAGFTEPELARRWMNVILLPWDAIRWHELQFSPEEAAEWQALGYRDPHAAKEQKRLQTEEAEASSQK